MNRQLEGHFRVRTDIRQILQHVEMSQLKYKINEIKYENERQNRMRQLEDTEQDQQPADVQGPSQVQNSNVVR